MIRCRITRFTAAVLLLFGSCVLATPMEGPLQSSSPIPHADRPPLPRGTTRQIASDWAQPSANPLSQPDHSFRTVWMRMFPLISVPLSDPYPQTLNVNIIDITNEDSFDVYAADTEQLLGNTKGLHLDFSQATFALGATTQTLVPLWIVPKTAQATLLDWDKGGKSPDGKSAEVGVRVRGGVIVRKTTFEQDELGKPKLAPQELWSVINVVKVEDYLLSVVPSEAVNSWHDATLQAQAIAARTYGLHEAASARVAGRLWDMDPTTWYQSYRGTEFLMRDGTWRPVEVTVTSKAVTDTVGQTVVYNGEVIQAYFSANSGGVTCTVAECFGLQDLPYLDQRPDAKGILQEPGGTWGASANITPQSVTDVLLANGITPASPVLRLEALKLGPSQRVWQLRVILKQGFLDLDLLQTRKIMRTFGAIRSFLYKLGDVAKDGKQRIEGHGYGHGVGLSQYGAELFAKKGWNAQRIITYYYPKTSIKKLTGN